VIVIVSRIVTSASKFNQIIRLFAENAMVNYFFRADMRYSYLLTSYLVRCHHTPAMETKLKVVFVVSLLTTILLFMAFFF